MKTRAIKLRHNDRCSNSFSNFSVYLQALQAPACHENMVKVGGYILGEFGNLIAGDTRSSPAVQFKLLHSKYHLCSPATRGLLLTAYVKFVNLFPEIKPAVQAIFSLDSNLKSADAELQQRASEYLALGRVTTLDVLATVLEEMPPFPEKESCGLLNLLKKKRPGRVPDNPEISGTNDSSTKKTSAEPKDNPPNSNTESLLDLGGGDSVSNGNGLAALNISSSEPTNNLQKFYCKNNGVLYENDVVQIGVKTECKSNLARLALFYGNKTANPFINFQPIVTCSPELQRSLSIQVKTVDSTVEAGAQFQQMVNLECVEDFTLLPDLNVR